MKNDNDNKFNFFSFELDTKVPAGAIRIGHAVNANIYKMEELATIAGPSDGGNYTVGQIRSAFTQRWNIDQSAAAFLRKADGQSVEVNDSTVVEPGDELEFRAKDGAKGGLLELGYAELKKIAKKLGLSGKSKADLAQKITAVIVSNAEETTLPLEKNKVVSVKLLRAKYAPVRYEIESANRLSIAELVKNYPNGVIEKGQVVEYLSEPDGQTIFVAEYQSEKYIGQTAEKIVASIIANEGATGYCAMSKEGEEVLSAGETLWAILE